MVLFITLYKVVLIFKSVGETLVCDHSYESYLAVLSCCTRCMVLNFLSVDKTIARDHI